jgi:hypothetical protein
VDSETRPTALPERTSETVVWETPACLATSMLVTLRELREAAPVTGRELREFEAMPGLQHAGARLVASYVVRWYV